ncbi:LysR family transcriptional regulator [Ruegeria sp. ANG-R]|uniref:LysR family transcriptional regulator n=1 Tax=Ruegeria sp. ANG-R TaxID=1577903 RepID=UPI00057D400A|nr:LysR family transcriptional regulator [Ruegeria sp. ANG-R]KIC41121.1 LysR family transcriptional regulator [Ruegeria sp. ANG-R]
MTASLAALRAFDAAARNGSFRAAAADLTVTPTAISHHIRGLEDQLGVKLFRREGRDVVLTDEGRRLADATIQAFGLLDTAIGSLRRNARKAVRVSAGPIFTARWLMPRLSDFWGAHREIELEVVPALHPGARDRENVDIVIRWDRIADMTGDAVKLLELSPVAIASEEFVTTRGPIEHPKDLLTLPLLHQRNHWGWLDWFEAMGVSTTDPLYGPIFEDANVLLRGAAEGQGAIIGWLPLIDQDLAENRVVRIFDERIAPTHGYFIDVQHTSRTRSEVREVEDWLVTRS